MQRRGLSTIPALRTIGYILERNGVIDSYRRIRCEPPPKGWYLKDVADNLAEIDHCDFIEDLFFEGGATLCILNVVALHSGLQESFPRENFTAQAVKESLTKHWQKWGLPDYAQFDNDIRFQGPRQYADTIGTIIKLCLNLSVVPIFAPPYEQGFQNAVESFNARWQQKVWRRFHYDSLQQACQQSRKYVAASRMRNAARIEKAPQRREYPKDWGFDPREKVSGRIIYIRRTSEKGEVNLLGHSFAVSANWLHRLVRCEVDIEEKQIRFYALRRKAPEDQPLLRTLEYRLHPRYVGD